MKTVLVFVLALGALVAAYPRAVKEEDSMEKDPASDTELFVVPLSPRRPSFGFGLHDELAPPPLDQHPFFRISPWGRPDTAPADQEQVDDFMTQMQAMLSEMRRQITEMLHRSHSVGGVSGEEDISGTGVGTRIGAEGDLPQNKTTSTTKVIDGHVVTVNETTFSSGDDNIGAVFRIKVVEVVPSESPEGETENKSESEAKPESEPTTSKSEADADKHEETNEIPNQKVSSEWSAEFDPSVNDIDNHEDVSGEWSPDTNNKENYYNLRDDTNVNQYVSDQVQSQGLVMIEPDAEVFDSDLNSYYRYESVPQRLQRFP